MSKLTTYEFSQPNKDSEFTEIHIPILFPLYFQDPVTEVAYLLILALLNLSEYEVKTFKFERA